MSKTDVSAELSKKANELSAWKSLIESPAWEWYKKTMEMQRTARLFMVGETPLKALGDCLGQEFMKGEGAGIGLSLMLPYTQIEILTMDVARLSIEVEQEKENVQEDGNSAESRSRVDDKSWHDE